MALKTREILAKIKAEIDAITPAVGKTFSTLRTGTKPEDVDVDYRFKDPVLGDVFKAFIIKPGIQRVNRASLGPGGFSKRDRLVLIEGFVSSRTGNEGAADSALEDAFDAIMAKLQTLQRLESKSQGDTFFPGIMELTPLAAGKVSNKNVVVAELQIVVQDRFGGAC